jgi:hypothetical protein
MHIGIYILYYIRYVCSNIHLVGWGTLTYCILRYMVSFSLNSHAWMSSLSVAPIGGAFRLTPLCLPFLSAWPREEDSGLACSTASALICNVKRVSHNDYSTV